jgi:TRAP-type C4-dicarboxylate transport system permease small subunit
MQHALDKVERILHRVIVVIGDAILLWMLFCCVLQVVTRFVFNDSLTWTEEMARFAFIWVSFLGAALCVEQDSHARISILSDMLPKKLQTILYFAGQVIIIISASVMVWQGAKLLKTVSMQTSPMLGIPMSVFYGAAPVSAVLMAIYSMVKILRAIFSFNKAEAIEAVQAADKIDAAEEEVGNLCIRSYLLSSSDCCSSAFPLHFPSSQPVLRLLKLPKSSH